MFVGSGATWTRVQVLRGSGTANYDYFGYDFSLDGETLAVGATGADDAGHHTGSAYVFIFDGAA
ncbi:MAG: hypothetical protein ACI841_000582 [Planctomycetota bacterium]